MLVRDRMSTPAITVRPDTSFQQALALMYEHGIRRLPVVDDRGALIGIVAQRDLLVAALRYLTPRGDVTEVMATKLVTVTPGMTLADVAQRMIRHKVGGLPVVEENKLVGIITESDIFRAFVELHGAMESAGIALKREWGRDKRGAEYPPPG